MFQEISWTRAIQEAAATLKQALATHGPQGVAVLASPQMTNEELSSFAGFSEITLELKESKVASTSDAAVYSDDFLITADKNPNTRGRSALPSVAAPEAKRCSRPVPKATFVSSIFSSTI